MPITKTSWLTNLTEADLTVQLSQNLDSIRDAINDNNQNIDDELKDNIYILTQIFHSKYPEIDLTNLCNNLKTLKIVKSSKFLNKRVSKYNFMTNTLEFNVEKIAEGYDMKHMMMFELLNIITNNGKMTGFNLCKCFWDSAWHTVST